MIYHAETLQFQVLTVDQFTHAPGLFSVKGRSYAALSFRFCGEGAFSVDGTQFLSRPNDVLFLPAGVDYQVRYTHGVSIVVHLLDCNYTVTEQIPQVPFLSAAFTDLLTDWKTQRQMNAVKSGVYGILAALTKRQSAAASQEIAPALAYLQANHTKPHLSVEEAARAAHMSPSTLRRAFAAYLGISPKQYVEDLRLEEAVRLLLRGLFVKEVAAKCGFADEKYFSRAMKKRYGFPPSALRP